MLNQLTWSTTLDYGGWPRLPAHFYFRVILGDSLTYNNLASSLLLLYTPLRSCHFCCFISISLLISSQDRLISSLYCYLH